MEWLGEEHERRCVVFIGIEAGCRNVERFDFEKKSANDLDVYHWDDFGKKICGGRVTGVTWR
jgi:hypothetical protein